MIDWFYFQVTSGFCQSGFQSAALPKRLSGPLTDPNNILTTLSLPPQNTPLLLRHTHSYTDAQTHKIYKQQHTHRRIVQPFPTSSPV